MIELYIILLILGCIIHELLHSIAYIILGINFNHIKYGIMWKKLAPYTYCETIMPVWKYRISLLFPNIFFLLIVLIFTYINMTIHTVFSNALFICSIAIFAGGASDLYVFLKTLKLSRNTQIKDSLTKIGYDVINNNGS